MNPIIKQKKIGPYVDREGAEYYRIYSYWQMPFVAVSAFLQYWLWIIGVAVHNPVTGECTADFNCCEKGIGKKAFIRVNEFLAEEIVRGIALFCFFAVIIDILW